MGNLSGKLVTPLYQKSSMDWLTLKVNNLAVTMAEQGHTKLYKKIVLIKVILGKCDR